MYSWPISETIYRAKKPYGTNCTQRLKNTYQILVLTSCTFYVFNLLQGKITGRTELFEVHKRIELLEYINLQKTYLQKIEKKRSSAALALIVE